MSIFCECGNFKISSVLEQRWPSKPILCTYICIRKYLQSNSTAYAFMRQFDDDLVCHVLFFLIAPNLKAGFCLLKMLLKIV